MSLSAMSGLVLVVAAAYSGEPAAPDPVGAQVAELLQEAQALDQTGKCAAAAEAYEKALKLRPDDPTVLNGLAWLLATCPEGKVRDGPRAVEFAQKAVVFSGCKDAGILDTLAAAHAEAGQFEEAVKVQKGAIALLKPPVDTELLAHLKLYESRQPYREDPRKAEMNAALAECQRLESARRHTEAMPYAQRAVEVSEKIFGPEHPDVARSLNALALLCLNQGRYAAAEPLFKRALAINEKALGPGHPHVAAALNNLASLYERQDQYAAAEPLHQRALVIREKALGAEHPDVAESLDHLARLYRQQAQYAAAEPLFKRALAIREDAWGPEHLSVATSLNNLALLYQDQGQYAAAEPLFKRSLSIREKLYGPEHPNAAVALNNLAMLYYAQGQYDPAEPLFKRALMINENAHGPEDRNVATALNNLAVLYKAQAQYAAAEPFYKRVLAIWEKVFGPEHPNVAVALHNLAALHEAQGQYAAAEPLYKRSLAIREKAFGPEHPDVASTLSGLASLYKAQGQYAAAERLHKRALAIREKALGPEHPDVARSLNNLAVLYEAQCQYAAAEPLHKRALAIWEKVLGREHSDVATSLNNLAGLYANQDQYAVAEPLYKRSLAIREKALGPEHPDVAQSLNNLALLFDSQGQYAAAEPLYKRSLAIKEKVLGLNHPDVALSLNNLAGLYQAQDQPGEALQLRVRASAIEEKTAAQVFSIGSEQARFAYVATLAVNRNSFLTLCLKDARGSAQARESGLDLLLRRQGLVSESLLADRQAARAAKDPALSELAARLRAARERMSRLVLSGPGKMSGDEYRRQIVALDARIQEVEGDWAKGSAVYRAQVQTREADSSALSRALPPGAALVHYARYHVFNFKAINAEPRWEDWVYAALVLKAGEQTPAVVAVGKAEPIEAAIRAYGQAAGSVARSLGKDSGTAEKDLVLAAAKVREWVWDPVAKELGACKQVFVCPDAELNFVAFGALPSASGDVADTKFLLEDYDIRLVSTGRDLIRPSSGTAEKAAVVFGAPSFGGLAAQQDELAYTRDLFRSLIPDKSAFGGVGEFAPLPGTLGEATAVARLSHDAGCRTQLLTGLAATEGRLKAVQHPQVLYLATHGFFLPDSGLFELANEKVGRAVSSPFGGGVGRTDSSPCGSGGLEITRGVSGVSAGEYHRKNPMLRSGLALAGANLALKGDPPEGQEDGIVTAEEVAGLDLAGTQLVVLSACQTGVGQAQGGEGVLGLRRAFVLAGAENLVMSLWPVSDVATKDLLSDFYKRYLSGQSPTQALRAAQLEFLKNARASGKRANPYYWGAFVHTGIGTK